MQRFRGLDRHRPCGALPAGGWSASFLPLFVGMTPLATDGPRGGSGAGFGRDHAEKWRSGGVSRTTLVVTKTTSPAGLEPAGTTPRPITRSSGTSPRRRARAPPTPPSRMGRAQQTETDRAIGLHYSANGTGSNRGPICLEQVVRQRKTLFFCRLRAGAGRVRAVGLGLVAVRHLRAGVGWDANLSPGLGRGGLARLTAVPGAGDDGSLSGAAVLPRTVGGNLSRLLVGNEQVVLYHVLRLAPAQGEGL